MQLAIEAVRPVKRQKAVKDGAESVLSLSSALKDRALAGERGRGRRAGREDETLDWEVEDNDKTKAGYRESETASSSARRVKSSSDCDSLG